MLKKLCVAAGLTLALGSPVFAEEQTNDPGLGLPGSGPSDDAFAILLAATCRRRLATLNPEIAIVLVLAILMEFRRKASSRANYSAIP